MNLSVNISFLIFSPPPKMEETSKSCSKYCFSFFGYLEALHSAVSCLILRLKLCYLAINEFFYLAIGFYDAKVTQLVSHPDTGLLLNFELIYKETVITNMLIPL